MEMAVHEGLNNALRAGEHVEIILRCSGERLIVRIKDDGPGFAAGELNYRLKTFSDEELTRVFEEKRMEEHGRGILLMKAFMDKLVYSANGKELLMIKRLVK